MHIKIVCVIYNVSICQATTPETLLLIYILDLTVIKGKPRFILKD